jgi:hypothetical protein
MPSDLPLKNQWELGAQLIKEMFSSERNLWNMMDQYERNAHMLKATI